MAYLALYRKWRPATFDEVVGQKHISTPLKRAILTDRLAHAYLFSGPRGTGKTSMAKILSKAVNCEHLQDGNPCNVCDICRDINNGASLDVYEIDAASNRGIEEIRALKESVRTLPAASRKKVYIIDEVHMLTKEAFNALLKTLEEPPSHVLFILATTEPEKIPLTILSRCQRYEFHRISVSDIRNHLLHVAEKSDLSLTEEAADLIAVRSDGGLRDALSLLDQCSSASETGVLDAKTVYDLLGITGKDEIMELFSHIRRSQGSGALSCFYQILQQGKEPSLVLVDLLEHLRNLMICKINPKAPDLSVYGQGLPQLKADAEAMSDNYMDALFESLHETLVEARKNQSPRLSAEMGLLRLCRIKGAKNIAAMEKRLARLEQMVDALTKKGAPLPQAEPRRLAEEKISPAAVMQKEISPAVPQAGRSEKPEKKIPSKSAHAPLKKETPKREKDMPAASNASDDMTLMDPGSYERIWKDVLAYFMAIPRIDVWSCMQKGRLIFASSARAIVSVPQPFLVLAINNKAYQEIAAEAFLKITGKKPEVKAVLQGSPDETEVLAQRDHMAKSSVPAANKTAPPPDKSSPESNGYRKVEKNEIPQEELASPALAQALKIATDCDIYEKDAD